MVCGNKTQGPLRGQWPTSNNRSIFPTSSDSISKEAWMCHLPSPLINWCLPLHWAGGLARMPTAEQVLSSSTTVQCPLAHHGWRARRLGSPFCMNFLAQDKASWKLDYASVGFCSIMARRASLVWRVVIARRGGGGGGLSLGHSY